MSLQSSPQMEKALSDALAKGLLTTRTENNQYLKISYKGTGTKISDKWNVKIYTSGSVVCNDPAVLQSLMDNSFKEPDTRLRLLQIDDAGVGFPLCGVMIGVTNGERVWTDTVDVSFFQSPKFEKKLYVDEFAKKGLHLLSKTLPSTHRIEICSGFINTGLRDALRARGYAVRITEIKGLLQDNLEQLFKEYVKKETGQDLAYDPKEIKKEKLGKAYYQVLDWGKKHTPHLLKSGWNSIK
jgi:hypothetical protein